MAKEKTVKMRFSKDMFYNDLNVPMYDAGQVYDIPMSMMNRWIKRGGMLVSDDVVLPVAHAPVAPVVRAPPTKVPETPNGKHK